MHDIGKAMSHELEGSPSTVPTSFKSTENTKIVHAVAAHHEEIKPETALCHLVITADSISGGRPGGTTRSHRIWHPTVHDLEAIAPLMLSKAYAIQAGREPA
ncbi:MAG: hypothetical protein IPK53_11140 [bacterium]|nr:hypothetical protein [bacterium]